MIGLIFGFLDLAWAGFGLLLMILIFQLVTLPTEFNASKSSSIYGSSNTVQPKSLTLLPCIKY